jgi:hypothetical protein
MAVPSDHEPALLVVGALADAPGAAELAREVAHLLYRYAEEVVAGFALCPHMTDLARSVGAVCIVLDRTLDAGLAARSVRATGSKVAHVVCPLASGEASDFERFGNEVVNALASDGGPRLVHATFHPQLGGGTEYPARLVGVLRRAPDPFVQLIPVGIQQGGTSFAGSPPQEAPYIDTTYRRLQGDALEVLLARQAELHAARRALEPRLAALAGAG